MALAAATNEAKLTNIEGRVKKELAVEFFVFFV